MTCCAHQADDHYCDWCGKDKPVVQLVECGEYLVCRHCARADEDEREHAEELRAHWTTFDEWRTN